MVITVLIIIFYPKYFNDRNVANVFVTLQSSTTVSWEGRVRGGGNSLCSSGALVEVTVYNQCGGEGCV